MKKWLWLAGALAIIVVVAYANRERRKRVDLVDVPATPVNSIVKTRPIFQYSLVPGGLHSLQDFRDAMRDPVLSKAYEVLDINALHPRRLTKDACLFVQAKKDGAVFWTKHCILVHAGEIIWTDGRHSVLARCGNLVAYVPQEPQIDVETSVLNTVIGTVPVPDSPGVADAIIPPTPLPQTPVQPESPGQSTPEYPYPAPVVPIGVVPRTISVGAGENWTVLVVGALIIAVAFYIKRKR